MSWKFALTSAATVIGSAITTTVYLEEKNKQKTHDQLRFLPIFSSNVTLEEAVKKTEQLCLRVKDESGTPGLVVSVTVDGKPVLNKGIALYLLIKRN